MKPKNIIFDLNGVLFEESLNNPEIWVPIDEGIEVLRDCATHRAGHSLYACSNVKPRYLEQLNKHYSDIMGLFTGIVTPETAFSKKPDPEIFRFLLNTYGLLPKDSVFLDDHKTNIAVAQSLGLSGIHVIAFDQVRQELGQLGVL